MAGPADEHGDGPGTPKGWRSVPRVFRLLTVRVWLERVYNAVDRYRVLFWAGVMGILGGLASVFFREVLSLASLLFTGHGEGMVAAFADLPPWRRLVTPAAGGLVAGLVIYVGGRIGASRGRTTDFMEAVSLGDGTLSVRSSLTKIVSSLFSISSGGSIGREGPMVQLAAVVASVVGRTRRWTLTERRLLVACGAAAGLASVYNAPIGGALFVAEVVLGSIAMETLGPLLLASVLATQTSRFLMGGSPLYAIPPFKLESGLDLVSYLVLGVAVGLAAPLFLRALRASERLFLLTRLPVYVRLALGGLVVGGLAVWYPQVTGNGYSVVNAILREDWLWPTLAAVMLFKLLATSASFGSGAVGGVFTPTLFMGASLGYLFGHAHQAVGLGAQPSPGAFALTGMGMFLAATTHAPLMAILMVFEMTLDYQLILPLMLGCVVAYFTAQGLEPRSIYSGALKRKGAAQFALRLASLKVADLMRPDPIRVREDRPFIEIARYFIRNTSRYLYVVDEDDTYLGAISLQDVKEHLGTAALAHLVVARDLLTPGPPPIQVSATLEEALERFARHDLERVPVVTGSDRPRVVGALRKTDLLLALAERNPSDRRRRDLETPDA